MQTHRIGELHVRVRARPDAAPTEAEVRGYATAVWDAVGTVLERRHPGRVYRVRSWEGRWRVTRSALRDRPSPALVDELVGFCERVGPMPPDARPDAAADVVCFAAEPERVAAWWLARAAGEPSHWAWSDLDRAPSVDAVLHALGDAGAAAAERCLAAAGSSAAALAQLARHRLRVREQDDAAQGTAATAAPAAGMRPQVRPPAAGEPPSTQPPGGHARPRDPPAATAGPRPAVADEETFAASSGPGARPSAMELMSFVRASSQVAAPGPETVSGEFAHRTAAAGPAAAGEPAAAGALPVTRTQWGGLVHLLGPMLECRVMQTLWEACLDERAVLRRALSALCGNDPIAATLSGGETMDGPLLDAERLADVRSRLVSELRRAIPRRGLAAWPPLALSSTPAGAVALHAPALPWAIAAWPDARQAEEQAAALAGAEPAADAPQAVWHPPEREPRDAALVAMVIGIPATLLALRLGWSGDAVAFADRWLRRPAWITDDGEVIEMRFSAEMVDLTLRRNGGDADPGPIPWLGRTVRLHYDASETR